MKGTRSNGSGDRRGDERSGDDAARTGAGSVSHVERLTETPRRSFLKAAGAAAVAGTFLASTGSAAAATGEFVETDGPQFVLGGDPIYFTGSNNFWITDPYAERSYVDRTFQLYADQGFNLVRTWAFCEGGGGHCLQPEPGVHDEAGLQHLDFVVAKAKEYGLRLVFSFVDNWDAYGGIDQYVSWASGASVHGDFYQNAECKELYRNHVETIVTRTNSITGVEYRNEPAIAIWELANEPRLDGDGFGSGNDPGNAQREDILANWFSEMGSFVKELDSNHLVTTGLEGFYTREGTSEWYYNDWTGQDYVRHHSLDSIDVCSYHMYPYHWDDPPDGPFPLDFGDDWITEHVQDAHEQVGKPAYLGEFNVNVQAHDVATRNQYLQEWYGALDSTNGDAATIWQMVVSDESDHDGFQVYESESGDILQSAAATARSKSGDASGSPVADAVGPDTLRIGESGSFDAAYSFDPDGSVASYDWDFGDGTSGTGESVYHRYAETGTYDVQLSLSDSSGNTGTDTETVTVEGILQDSFIVEGAGETLHNSVKEFHYAYVPISGEFTVEATVATVAGTSPDAQVGIMTVDDPSAPGALGAATVTPGSGTEMTRAYQDTTWRERTSDDRAPPLWLRLERTGGSGGGGYEVHASVSEDGSSWTEIQTGQVDMAADAYVGLFVSSNSPGELCTAQFDDVTWLDGWSATDVGPVEVAGATTAGTGETGGGGSTATDSPTDTATPPDGTGDCDAAQAPAQVGGSTPHDLDGDGLYMDVNGNCRLDNDDVVTYFEEMDSSGITNNVAAYDYNGNGRIDFDDLVTLFESL